MLSFLKSFLKKEPWASPGNMTKWLKHLPAGDIQQTQFAIVEMLNRYFKSDDSLNLNCLPAMWILSEEVGGIIQQLVSHYLQNYKISTSTERAIRDNLFEITQRLSQVYESILDFDSNGLLKILGKEGTARSIAYYIHYKVIQAKIRLFRFEQWVPAQWAQLHACFTLAEQANVNRLTLRLFNLEEHEDILISTTIELEYVHLLLLQLLNIGSLEPHHIQQAHIWLIANASAIKIDKEPHAEGFMLDLNSKDGLMRVEKTLEQSAPTYSIRYVNTYSITAQIQSELETTRALMLETRDSFLLNASIFLLEKCYGLWNYNKCYWQRNGNREASKGNVVWMIDNWQSIFQVIPPIPGSESFVPPAVSIYTLADQCALLDTSSSGYGVLAPINEIRPFKLGMLLLIYEEEKQHPWHLCVLRRLKKIGLDQAEIGLEIVATYVYSMCPVKYRKSLALHGMDGYEVDVGDHLSQEDYISTLYITPQINTKAGNKPSLFILRRDYHGCLGHKLPLKLENGLFTIVLGDIIEESTEWLWCSFVADQHQEKSE